MMNLLSLSGAAWLFLAETRHLYCCSCFSLSLFLSFSFSLSLYIYIYMDMDGYSNGDDDVKGLGIEKANALCHI
ncbi:unnamed protein product [Arabidopsis halleri]